MNYFSPSLLSRKIYTSELKESSEGFPGMWDLIIAFFTMFMITNISGSTNVSGNTLFFLVTYSFFGSVITIHIFHRYSQLKKNFKNQKGRCILGILMLAMFLALTYSFFSFTHLNDTTPGQEDIGLTALLLSHTSIILLHNWLWMAHKNVYQIINSIKVSIRFNEFRSAMSFFDFVGMINSIDMTIDFTGFLASTTFVDFVAMVVIPNSLFVYHCVWFFTQVNQVNPSVQLFAQIIR